MKTEWIKAPWHLHLAMIKATGGKVIRKQDIYQMKLKINKGKG
jgi:hypothetical protein